ncbi:hypothetical protein BJX70DRAFT_389372 [Aspergillus crustosus]
MPPQTPTSRTTIYLDQPPSCLQFCPASPNNLVIGTYLLSENKSTDSDGLETIQQKKTGSLHLWHLDPENDSLNQISRYAIDAAVFDLHFHPVNPEILAIATSTGCISLFSVFKAGFTLLWNRSVHEDPTIPALYLAWVPAGWLEESLTSPVGSQSGGGNGDGFAVTFSDGRTGVFSLNRTDTGTEGNGEGEEDEPITEVGSFMAKQPIEVWFVAAASYASVSETEDGAKQSTPYLFTGDDFGTLTTRRFADVAAQHPPTSTSNQDGIENTTTQTISPLLLNSSDKALHHNAGVTSILPLPIPLFSGLTNGEPLLLTGSYDEYLRVYHAKRGGEVIAEAGLGGGVWRLQLVDIKNTGSTSEARGRWEFLVLASCMHAGTRVVRVTIGEAEDGGAEADIEVLAEFTEHESMNYASDVWRANTGVNGIQGSELRVVSSSFYDRRVCVWRVDV